MVDDAHVAIVIPLYNEEMVVGKVLQELREKYSKYKIIVIDDCSTDKSYEAACLGGVYMLRHMVNLGQGAALQTGIEFAKKLDCKYIVMFDSDGQHDPDDIAPFVLALDEDKADMVLGSRFLGKTENMPLRKKYLLKLSRIFTWVTTGIWLSDSHNGLRALNIEKFPNFEITQNRMAHASEIISIIKMLNMRYIEMPCKIRYTQYSLNKGQSMWNSVNIIVDYFLGSVFK